MGEPRASSNSRGEAESTRATCSNALHGDIKRRARQGDMHAARRSNPLLMRPGNSHPHGRRRFADLQAPGR
jgi:hypothetical protein